MKTYWTVGLLSVALVGCGAVSTSATRSQPTHTQQKPEVTHSVAPVKSATLVPLPPGQYGQDAANLWFSESKELVIANPYASTKGGASWAKWSLVWAKPASQTEKGCLAENGGSDGLTTCIAIQDELAVYLAVSHKYVNGASLNAPKVEKDLTASIDILTSEGYNSPNS